MGDEEGLQRAQLQREFAADANLGRHHTATAVLPARVLASWQRSEAYGVSLDVVEPTFTHTIENDSLLYESGRDVLTDMQRTLGDEPVGMMVTDAEGVVLIRQGGDRSLLESLDADRLAPGFGYSEREAGTNGLGLALADQRPTFVCAEQHYARSLCRYNCAAAPVYHPLTGALVGSINLTTWAITPSQLLLTLADAAAKNTSALMQARSGRPSSARLGEPDSFKIQTPSGEPDPRPTDSEWSRLVGCAAQAISIGRVVLAVGEVGTERRTLLTQAQRRDDRSIRIVTGRLPDDDGDMMWPVSWASELRRPHSSVIVLDVDTISGYAARHFRDLVLHVGDDGPHPGSPRAPISMTATSFADISPALARIIDTIIEIPPLRNRVEDVLPLSHSVAHRVRGRNVSFTPAAQEALCNYPWPGNVVELRRVITDAAQRTNVVDVQHLPPQFFTTSRHRLSRIETFERDEIVRVLSEPNIGMATAATRLGISRATLYRRLTQYGIRLPRSSKG